MKLVIKSLMLCAALNISYMLFAKEIAVFPKNAVIVLPNGKNRKMVTSAGKELQKHLKLITGSKIKIVSLEKIPSDKYVFRVGFPIPGDSRKLAPEEARWKVTDKVTYFYGDDSKYRDGTLFAVYDFLEQTFNIRWIEPGDIAFVKQNPLKLRLTSSCWKPTLRLRNIRGTFGKTPLKTKNPALKEFQLSQDEHDKFKAAVLSWRKQMRMGSHDRPHYGHAFENWWKLYGKKHPKYFALNKLGTRTPLSRDGREADNPVAAKGCGVATRIKLCVSNTEVAEQIVKNWRKRNESIKYINACTNDSPPRGFCRCSNCRKLDVPLKEEKFAHHLTDRYVYFANRIVSEAKKYNPAAKVVIYAYNETEHPPRREQIDAGVVIGLVSTNFDLKYIDQLFSGWKAKGAKNIFFRPNQHHYYFTLTIPPGFEKHFYDVFQTAYKNNSVGFDYDCLINNWLVTGMTDYVLAKAMSDPDKTFAYWENHYLDAFGTAKPDIRKYFRYWRNDVWEKRINPNLSEIVRKGKWYNFARGLMWNLAKYYKESDFDKTDIFLVNALKHKLSPQEIARVKRLQLANRHARLVFKAITTNPPEKFKHSLELLAFRQKNRDFKNVMWSKIFNYEGYWGDVTGVRAAVKFKDYSLPFIKTPHFWFFKLDPDNIGTKEQWYKGNDMKSWDLMATNHFWEKPHSKYIYPSAETRKKLVNYNGIGWYSCKLKVPGDWKNRKVLLYFGAVDESCWVYVNGKLAGQHLFKKPNDWNIPFTIDISDFVDWSKLSQIVTVKVEDKNGAGGIWKPVWLVSQK